MRSKPGRVTIYDVAARAGVSISTVSLVVNAPHRVRPETRERIVTAAAELGYRMGPGRRVGAARIAVAAPFTTYPSYLRRLSGMLLRARTAAADVIPYDLDSAASAESPLLETLPARADVSGLVVMGVPLGAAARRASRAARIPVVYVDVVPAAGAPVGPVVLVDDRAGGAQIGAHLAALGHRRVAFVHEAQRSRGYVSAGMLRAEGLAGHVEVRAFAVPGPERVGADVLRAVRSWGATAIAAGHDHLAAAVLVAIREDPSLGAFAVVGYDDGDLARALDLTTVRQPLEETGRVALELVLGIVAGGAVGAGEVVRLAPELIVRGSSGTADHPH
ncbi:LacI family transcriptional regulator [Microbacterium resistens]|uniref:LacI family transcriptional regulator n=1 Tax=Microbacterium resistens TaxID=156977 RepID=A0ABU1S7Z4_9MICO|nr:LacI family DNA-binding transcriptional regulator [Microbacterium resistens]MDR6865716.1 LacI family transcriptional regulator [Microbacterium resistens]